jgi:hypothetical protein
MAKVLRSMIGSHVNIEIGPGEERLLVLGSIRRDLSSNLQTDKSKVWVDDSIYS